MVDGMLPAIAPGSGIGAPTTRLDGPAKVTGRAQFGSDFDGGGSGGSAGLTHAYLLTSPISRGRITAIDESSARAVPGVLDILTYKNVGDRIKPGKMFEQKGYMGTTIAPLASNQVHHAGQIVAVVVAETFETAREASWLLRLTYAEEKPTSGFDSEGATTTTAESVSKEGEEKPKVGDAAGAFTTAAIKVDAYYSTPVQHHNPIELFHSTCAWQGDKLTVWESSQNVHGLKNGLAEQLGIDPAQVRAVSPYIGGAFGSRGSLSQHTALVALAARQVGRPVRLEVTRAQGYTVTTYRAETRHRIRLGAGSAGRLQALIHEGWEVTSRPDNYKVAGTDASTRTYACPNVDSEVTMVHADRNTPGFMRAPAEVPYYFALESAMDELAVALRMDPVELRRVNDTDKEPIHGLPYTSRSLMPCFDAAAKAFGWSGRDARPGSMRDGDWLVGWGCATSIYPTNMAPATARVTLMPDGTARVQAAAHEIGVGITTAMALTVVEGLGVKLDQVTVELGDSALPPSPVAGGSNQTASVCNIIAKACEDIRSRIAAAAVAADGPHKGADPATLKLSNGTLRAPGGAEEPMETALGRASGGAMEAYAENMPHGVPDGGLRNLYKGQTALMGGAKMKDRVQFAWGAQFVEVRVNRRTREIRAPRLVGAFAAGRIVNPLAVKSQLMGGQIWGISSALHEATTVDPRTARYTNADLAEYLIPVSADVGEVETIILPEQDSAVNALGIKGVGELGIVGLNAAVANAVFHATGMRIRDLPIRVENLLGTLPGLT